MSAFAEPAPSRARLGWPVWVVPGLLTLGITLVGIGHAQPWRDELATWSAATRPLPDLVRLTRVIDAATGPYYALMHGWTALVGTSPTALRLPSALAMAAAAALTARLGARLVGDRAGLLAGLLFAVLPATSRYGQEARPYALATLFAVLATLLLVDALRRPTRRRWAGYALAVAALALVHLIALTLLAAHAVVVLLTALRGPAAGRRVLVRWLLALLPAFVLVTPLALVARGQRGRQLDWVDPARLPDLAALPGGLAQSGVVGGFLLALAALGAVRLGRRALLPAAAVLLPVLLLFVAGTVVPLWVTRYLVFTVPFACLLAGAALAGTTPAGTTPAGTTPTETAPVGTAVSGTGPTGSAPAGVRLGAALALVALAGLLGLPDQAALRRTHEWPRSAPVDYAGAARVIAAGERPGDAIVYSPRDSWLFPDLGMAYHLRSRLPRDVLVVRDQRQDADLWATECDDPARCLAGVDRVWLVVTGRRADPLAAVPGAKGAALRDGFTVRQVWPRSGLTVALLAR
ncbi:glycosyltransferase family 39 protein [Micromonospora sp. WMMA1998]|uniref:glycosyltransferase family 39 protein n=1 Tax=Micromonospora sp. WMMA1998 TaxID=3015167 RepID=UPI00248B850E|nr:glycosyltransferase family 39 protein [Micromonospora sp. WMMA1998]WBC18069.1 glycosyltransferase family 39 protein [Micromonospora sp. WMMA1998]